MADFLASFNFGAADEEPFRDAPCASLEEVQSRFRDLFVDKVTERRAEHVATILEIGSSTQFTISSDQGDNADPSISTVSARDALVSQPQYQPSMQKAISQEILNAIGNIDASTWSIMDESRKTQGWVFTYICNHSWQQWKRQTKATQTNEILDYSQKELGSVSRARPAYDCQGTLTITFSKGNSAITLSYSHTPLHRTVGEIYDLFKPEPRPQRPPPTKKKTPASAKKGDTPRKKRPAAEANGEKPPKKRKSRPKAGAKNQLSQAELVPVTEGDFASVNGTMVLTADDASDHIALAALASATASEPANNAQATGNAAAEAPKNSTASLNVSPEEAARRSQAAIKKLAEAGIDPSTLSTDQFSIFSNQSPEVQAESVKMLVKYGAQRLHIVHPSKKDNPQPQADQPDAASVASGSVNPQLLGNTTGSEDSGAQSQAQEPAPVSKTPRKAKPGTKSRVFCFNCKLSKSKCSKDKPTCTTCQETGLTCEYPASKIRSRKSDAIVMEEADGDTIMSENVDAEGEANDEARTEAAAPAAAPSHDQPSTHRQAPIADMMHMNTDDGDDGSRPIGEASIHPTYETRTETSSVNWSSGLALPQGRVYYPWDNNNIPAAGRPAQSNVGASVDAARARGAQQTASSSAASKSRVPTPTQARLAEPPRERHQSPLERHNPMRHEVYQRSSLPFQQQSLPNLYSQPAPPSWHGSDPYRQSPNYGHQQGNYPQLDDAPSERIAYDPHAYKQRAPPRVYSQQQPRAPVQPSVANGIRAPNTQEAVAADTLQRFHNYLSNGRQ